MTSQFMDWENEFGVFATITPVSQQQIVPQLSKTYCSITHLYLILFDYQHYPQIYPYE